MNFQEEISDRYFSWKKPTHSKHKQLPPLNYTNLKINKLSMGEFISLIGVDFPIYILDVKGLEVVQKFTNTINNS